MSDIAEKIAALEAACNKAAEEGGMFARDWERLSSIQNVRQLIAHIRQQEAELVTLRDEVSRRKALDHENKHGIDLHNKSLCYENAALREANAALRDRLREALEEIKRAEEQEPVGEVFALVRERLGGTWGQTHEVPAVRWNTHPKIGDRLYTKEPK